MITKRYVLRLSDRSLKLRKKSTFKEVVGFFFLSYFLFVVGGICLARGKKHQSHTCYFLRVMRGSGATHFASGF